MQPTKKHLAFLFLFLALLSAMPLGLIFRNFFTYWLLTGTSTGKTIAFFLALALIFAVAHFKARASRVLPAKAHSIKIFAAGVLLLYMLATFGLHMIFSAQVYDLDMPNDASTFLFVYSPDATVSVNWLAFVHNHYLKPIITPLLYPLKHMPFDSALPVAGVANPWLLTLGAAILALTMLYGLAFLERFWNSKAYLLLYSIVFFGLVLSTVDGSLISAVAQINVILFALLLLHERFKERHAAFQVWLCLFTALATKAGYELLTFVLFGTLTKFAVVVLFAPFVASFVLPLLSTQQNKKIKYALFAAAAIFVIPYLIVMAPVVGQDAEMHAGNAKLNCYYLRFPESINEEQLSAFGEIEKINETTYRIAPKEPTTIKGMFQKLESRNMHAVILYNSSWP